MKVIKSIISSWFCLSVGSLGLNEGNTTSSIILISFGALVQFYSNKRTTTLKSSDKLISKQISAKKIFKDSKDKSAKKYFWSKNHVNGKTPVDFKIIAFAYKNSSGESSFRDVDVKAFDGHYIEGYCHYSHAFKNFRLDRIEGDIILHNTGEIIDIDEWPKK